MENKRYEIMAMRFNNNYIVSFGTAHSEKERYYLLMKALLSGMDYIWYYEY